MPPLVRKIEPGDVIGRCRIIRELGRGGVGTVYLATHATLKIEVALKVLSPSLSLDNPALAERFIREAQLAACIRHPNVIAVMDAGHDDGTGADFIVMEYVGGGSLSWHLRHGPLPEVKAFAIIIGIAQALVVAEDNRVVHRDIKPDNIMLDRRGTPKLADLGLAKQAIDSRTSLTLGGSYMGTPAYMSPDQARDAKIADTRDDIYSLGASFYECLTGQPPFQGETPYNIMSELLTKPSPRPRELRSEVSRCADLICAKMMAKNRELRYPDARTLVEDLQRAQTFGDAGLDRLDAANFDREALAAHEHEIRQERQFGIETSVDGVYIEPDSPMGRAASNRPIATLTPPRKTDSGVFGMAVLLIAFVTAATLLLAWAGPRPLAFFEKKFAVIFPGLAPEKPKTPVEDKPSKPVKADTADNSATERETHPASEPHPSAGANPSTAGENSSTSTQPSLAVVAPVALPVNPGNTPAVPALPLDTNQPGDAVPAQIAAPDSAFVARDIAEQSLPPGEIAPTGKAELMRIIGERAAGQSAPSTWRFYFYAKSATGHARIVSVSGGKTVKTGEDLVDALTPYAESAILPEEKLQIDSTQALQIAQALAPATPVSSSELTLLQQKNSVPMWKVTLWTRDEDGDERKLGDVMLLAGDGSVILNGLKTK